MFFVKNSKGEYFEGYSQGMIYWGNNPKPLTLEDAKSLLKILNKTASGFEVIAKGKFPLIPFKIVQVNNLNCLEVILPNGDLTNICLVSRLDASNPPGFSGSLEPIGYFDYPHIIDFASDMLLTGEFINE